jgi:hypothetical protein
MVAVNYVTFILIQYFCIATQVFFILPLALMFQRRFHFGTYIFITILLINNSSMYHLCQMTNGTACVFTLEVHALLDHITAEYGFIMGLVMFINFKSIHWMNFALLMGLTVYGYLKFINDNYYYLGVSLAVVGPLAFYHSFNDKYLPIAFFSAISFSSLGLVCYFLDPYYNITHPLWHTFEALGLFCYVVMIIYSEKQVIYFELQRQYPDMMICMVDQPRLLIKVKSPKKKIRYVSIRGIIFGFVGTIFPFSKPVHEK